MDAVGSAWTQAVDRDEMLRAPTAGVAFLPGLVRSERRDRAHGSRLAKPLVIGADIVAIAAGMALAALIRDSARHDLHTTHESIFLTAAVSIPIWLFLFARYKLYSAAAVASAAAELRRIVHATAAAVACTALVAIVLHEKTPRGWVILTFFTALVTVVAERTLVRRAFSRVRAGGRMRRRVVIIGANAEALGFAQMLQANVTLGYNVLGVLECEGGSHPTAGERSPIPVLGNCRDTLDIVKALDVTGVIIATSAVDVPTANRLARRAARVGVPRRAHVGSRRHPRRPLARPPSRTASGRVHPADPTPRRARRPRGRLQARLTPPKTLPSDGREIASMKREPCHLMAGKSSL